MEKRYPVISGAEAYYHKGNDIGVLISHGFMGTPQSVRYIAESLAQFGFTVKAPRLPGHGTHYFDLERYQYEEWYETLQREYEELKQTCSEVFVIGQSMGGTLALWLAHHNPEIKGIILINPALSIPSLEYLKERIGPRFIDEEEPDIKAEGVFEITYQKAPVKAIRELQVLMERTPAILNQIQCPVLGMKSSIDHVVPPSCTDYILNNISSTKKEIAILANSYHVASMDNDKEQIVKSSHRFIGQMVGQDMINV